MINFVRSFPTLGLINKTYCYPSWILFTKENWKLYREGREGDLTVNIQTGRTLKTSVKCGQSLSLIPWNLSTAHFLISSTREHYSQLLKAAINLESGDLAEISFFNLSKEIKAKQNSFVSQSLTFEAKNNIWIVETKTLFWNEFNIWGPVCMTTMIREIRTKQTSD